MIPALNIDEASPSLNQTLKGHWSRKHRQREKWQWLVRAARLEARAEPQRLAKARVTIERWSQRRLDHDNFIGGAKYIVDSLKVEGFIVDDSPEHVLIDYIQHIGEPHTRITIKAV